MDNSPIPNLNELSQKANQVYQDLPSDVVRQNEGKYIAIEIDSGDTFIGEDREDAVAKAKQKYPDALIFVRRIGSIEKISSHSSLQFKSSDNLNARIF